MPPEIRQAIGKWMSLGVDPDLLAALCLQESNFNSNAVRYEQFWRYLLDVEMHARDLKITPITEKVLQMCSWGPMQVMGSVAREFGYLGPLQQLCIPDNGIHYGALKISNLLKRLPHIEDAVSAYNQGSPAANPDGSYKNQSYVDSVMGYYGRKLYTREGETL